MSGTGDLPVVPAAGDHPDHDLLADLAAEVLADDLAGQVQEHVVGCPDCAGLLAEAEGIRTLLRQGEPDHMPDDVMDRLAAALAEVSPSSISEPEEPVRTGGDPRRRLTPALPKNRPAGDTGRLTRITTRATAPVESARRQAREEELADRPSLVSRLAPMLKVAATVVVLLGVGGLIFRLFTGSAQEATSASDAGSTAASAAPVLAEVQTTGTNYSASDLRKQVDSLVGATERAAIKRQAAPSTASDSSDGTAAPKSNTEGSATSSALAAGSDLLTSPAALRGCLSAIGADDDQPVAVDLARWDDREAAIIVLNADGGGYDVWVVSRTCAPNADGTIAQEHVDS